MLERDLVFIGGGHTHALVLRMLAMKPLKDVRLTLITDTLMTPYSGMLPGFISGHYAKNETHIDLNKLCFHAGVRLIHDRVIGIDVKAKNIKFANHAAMSYDKVSINTGSTPNLTVPGAKTHALGVKPVSKLTKVWERLMASQTSEDPHTWAVVGAGAAGVEMVLALAYRLGKLNGHINLALVFSDHKILKTYQANVRKQVLGALTQAGVELVADFDVAEVTEYALLAKDGRQFTVNKSIWCTPATAPNWPGQAGLATDSSGFIAVNGFLQSTSHVDVFASGDVCAMMESPRSKAGVYAVRSAPFLADNLRRAFAQKPLIKTKLQTDFLSLLSLGDKRAIGQRNGVTFSGGWVWKWKDYIDNKFMRLFDDKLPQMKNMADTDMHCGGCGSKIGPELLSDTLKSLDIFQHEHLTNPADSAEDAALALQLGEQNVWQSLDGFRAFTDDLYRLGVVATHHAVNDCYAMGLPPVSAQVWANLAFAHPRLIKRDFQQLMHGVTDALREHETALVGGHSTEGAETHVALVVNSVGTSLWPKNTIQADDWIMLNRPIGSGILLAAQMQGKAAPEHIESLWQHLLTSNREFFNIIKALPVHAATDVTGFGLLGHLLEMADGSNCEIQLDSAQVPLLPGTLELSQQGIASTLLPQLQPLLNKIHNQCQQLPLLHCLLDPQTQGGLVISVPSPLGEQLKQAGQAHCIGRVTMRASEHPITIR